MTKIHQLVERFLILVFVFCFGLVTVYVPHDFNKVAAVQAGGPAGGGATFPEQLVQSAKQVAIKISAAATAGSTAATAAATTNSFLLSNVLDGIAWSLAKNVLSQMTSSMVNWINSGFQGSPAFITDFKGFVAKVADEQFGSYLEALGGPFSFICAPFKLDVRLALAVTYDYQRTNGKNPPKSTCTLTGAIENVNNFIDGTEKFVETGGWNSFFKVTQNPNSLTPLGGILSAQGEASARITNARGEEFKLLDYGSGFLSSKVCEAVTGATASSTRKNCTISTPGKVINEALTFQTSSGPRSLISADEINEVVSALFAQITQRAFTGAAGLLGLSGGSGYVYNGQAYTTQVANAPTGTLSPAAFKTMVEDAIKLEEEYSDLIDLYYPLFDAYSTELDNDAGRRADAVDIMAEMNETKVRILINVGDPNAQNPDPRSLYGILKRFQVMMGNGVNLDILQEMVSEFTNNRNLHSVPEVEGKKTSWRLFFVN